MDERDEHIKDMELQNKKWMEFEDKLESAYLAACSEGREKEFDEGLSAAYRKGREREFVRKWGKTLDERPKWFLSRLFGRWL